MWWILLGVVIVAFVYWKAILPHKYWKNKNVKQKQNPAFILGDNSGVFFRKQSFAEMVEDCYNQFPEDRYSGIYQALLPTLVIRDPDLIKQITVKDFDHFLDHQPFIPDGVDDLWSKNLFALQGEKWRDMRATLSPSFTSSKMKSMFVLINDCAQQFVQHFVDQKEKIVTVEMKDTFTRYTNDIIATCAFGVKCDSLKERKNEFYMMGKEATDFSGIWKNVVFFGYFIWPSAFKYFGVSFFSERVRKFFMSLVKDTIKTREQNHIVRPDMINLLMEARKGRMVYDEDASSVKDAGFATVEESEVGTTLKKPQHGKAEITDVDITAQALIFFFAGFETVSVLMSFMSYELAINPEIQDRLIDEIDEAIADNGGKISYEVVNKMKYLDMVVSECLRKWPPAISTDRVCTKPYTIPPKLPGEESIDIKIGEILLLPTYGIQRDPKYFPEPDRFDPERFSEENRDKINPYSYFPFGSGPRNCIGSRFALMEAKLVFVNMLAKLKFVVIEKTDVPITLCKKQFNLTAANGFWLGLEKRI